MVCRPSLAALVSLLALPALAVAGVARQTASPAAKSPDVPASVRRKSGTASVRHGRIAAIDAAQETLALTEPDGKTANYTLTGETHFWKQRRSVAIGAFLTGDEVVAHVRKVRDSDKRQVTDLADAVSWRWLTELRRKTERVTITTLNDTTLGAAVGPEAIPVIYALSDKTLWNRAGKIVSPSAFKPGDIVWVAPRSLPSGAIMARAVADSEAEAARLKERTAASVRGVIAALDTAGHTLTLSTQAGDTRTLTCKADLDVRRDGKSLTWAALQTGQHVSARLRREGDDPIVWRITIETGKRTAKTRKSSRVKA